MGLENFTAARADVEYVTNLGQFRGDQTAIRAEYARTTGAMSDQALRTAIAQEKLNRAINRSGADSLGARRAALTYRKEIAAIAAESDVAAVSMRTGGRAARGFERDINAAGRGALAGTGLFKGLGRAVAFSSGLFLGGTGLIYAIRASTKAAEEHQVTEGQLEAAVHAAGLEYGVYRKQIDDTLASQRALTGFTEEETARAFTKLVRNTQNVGAALHYTQEAAMIARGADISLEQASNIVNKALANQTTGLRRLGVELPKGVSGYRALEIAGRKFAGSLASYTDKAALTQDRLNQVIHTTEVTVGNDLLPEITHYETHLTSWLSKTKNQEKIQRDVNTVMHDGATIVHGFSVVIGGADKVLGGFGNTVKVVLGTALVLKLAKSKLGATLLRSEIAKLGPTAAVSAAEADTAIASVGTAEEVATTKAIALKGALLGIAKIGAIAIGIDLIVRAHGKQGALAAFETIGAGGLIGAGVAGPEGAALAASGGAIYYGFQAAASHLRSYQVAGGLLTQDFKTGAWSFRPSTANRGPTRPHAITAAQAQALLDAAGISQRATGPGAAASEAAAKAAAGLARAAGPTSGSPTGGKSAATVDRASQLQLAISNANLAVSRGTPGAQQQLVAALKAEIDFDRKYEQLQKRLYDSAASPKAKKQHAQILEQLQADEQSSLDQITSIDQANASKRAAAARKRAEQLKKEHDRLLAARKARLQALTEPPVDLRIAEATAKAHGASEEKLLAIYDREQRALEQQVKTLEKIGAAKKYILAARQHEAAVQSKIDAINKKRNGKAQDIFAEAAAEFGQYGSNVAGAFGALSGQDARGLLGALLLETKKGNRTHSAVERNTRGRRPAAIDGARLAAVGGF